MKKILTFIFIFCMISQLYAGPSYLGLEFTKPRKDIITVLTSNGGNHMSFGNPKNDGTQKPIKQTFYVEYHLQSPGSLFVFFSAKNDLGYDGGSGDNSNPYMLAARGGVGGLNYGISATTSVDGVSSKNDSYTPVRINDALVSPVITMDLGNDTAGETPPPSKLTSGVVFRHYFSQSDIDTGTLFNSVKGVKEDEGFLTGKDTYDIIMDVNNHSYKAKNEAGEEIKGHLPSGLYYGYIVVHFTAL